MTSSVGNHSQLVDVCRPASVFTTPHGWPLRLISRDSAAARFSKVSETASTTQHRTHSIGASVQRCNALFSTAKRRLQQALLARRTTLPERRRTAAMAFEREWLKPLPPTITPAQFLRLTAARNAQLASLSAEDCARSAPPLPPKGQGEQAESSGHDELSSLCDHDPTRMLQALLLVPQKPRPSLAWLGTPATRAKAARLLRERRRRGAFGGVEQPRGAAELDRVSISGLHEDAGAGQVKLESTKAGKLSYNPQSHIKALESRVLEQRRKQEKERAARKLREDEQAQRMARVRALHTATLKCACSCC